VTETIGKSSGMLKMTRNADRYDQVMKQLEDDHRMLVAVESSEDSKEQGGMQGHVEEHSSRSSSYYDTQCDGLERKLYSDKNNILWAESLANNIEIFHKSVQDWIKTENADYGVSRNMDPNEIEQYKKANNIDHSMGHQHLALSCLRAMLRNGQSRRQLMYCFEFVSIECIEDLKLRQSSLVLQPMRMYGVAHALEHAIQGCQGENDLQVDRVKCVEIMLRLATNLSYIHLRLLTGSAGNFISLLNDTDQVMKMKSMVFAKDLIRRWSNDDHNDDVQVGAQGRHDSWKTWQTCLQDITIFLIKECTRFAHILQVSPVLLSRQMDLR